MKLHRIDEQTFTAMVMKTINKILNEAHGEPDPKVAMIYSEIIEDSQAAEIAEEYGLSEEEAAAEWFKGVGGEMDIAEDEMPLHREYVMDIPELEAELYHDYGAEYYFLVKKTDDERRDIPGFEGTWGDLDSLTNPFNKTRLGEAADAAGVMQTGCGDAPKGSNPEAGQYVTPFGPDKETSDRHKGFSVDGKAKWNKNTGNIQRREIYNAKR